MKYLLSYYVVFMICGFSLISFIPDLFSLPSAIVTISYRAIVLSVSLCLLILIKQQKFNKYRLIFSVFLGYYTFVFLKDLYYSDFVFAKSSPSENLQIYLSVVILPFLTLSIINIYDFKEFVLDKLILFLFIICTLAVYSGLKTSLGGNTRLTGNSILNPITIGHDGAMLFSLSYFRINYLIKCRIWKKIFHYVCILVSSLTIFLSASRGPLLGIVLIIVISNISFLLNSKSKFSVVNLLQTMLILSIVVYIYYKLDSTYTDNFTNRMQVQADSHGDEEARVLSWRIGLENISDSPFWGSHVTTKLGYIHNVFIEVVMATGIIGSSLFFFVVSSLLYFSIVLIKKRDESAWACFYFLLMCNADFFSGTLYLSDGLVPAIGVLIGMRIFERKKKPKINSLYVS